MGAPIDGKPHFDDSKGGVEPRFSNHDFREGKVVLAEPWHKVKPFREADAAVIKYLSAAECVRPANSCHRPFRDLARGALVTGCRYGELIRMRVAGFKPSAGTVTVRLSKAGKPRHIVLAGEGRPSLSN